MQDAKEEVRARLGIEDVIGEYVPLRRAGRNFKGLSPFSQEKTPSFYVSPEKQIWHDFSSNRGGDVFSFVMEAEGMDFRQALEHLARKAGVDLSLYDSKKSGDLSRKKRRLMEIHAWAAHYYQHAMLKNKSALDYIVKARGFNRAIIESFCLGYAPDGGSHLTNYLVKKGCTSKELREAGLVSQYGKDLFRGRFMIPLMDASGQVVGFTGRILSDIPNAPKYLNTPQTLIYDKSRHVFGFSQAKEALRKEGYGVIVEGNLDAVASHQAGVTQVVATAGTALTEHHLRTLKRLTGDIRLAFDADSAGVAATERAIGIASNIGVNLSIVSLPEGSKDPDELIKKDVQDWEAAIASAIPAMDWLLHYYEKQYDMSSAMGKRDFTSKVLSITRTLADPVEEEHYLAVVAEMTKTSLATIKKKGSGGEETKNLRPVHSHAVERTDERTLQQDMLLALAVIDLPSRDLLDDMLIERFDGDERMALVRWLVAHKTKLLEDTPKSLQEYDMYVKILLLKADARYGDWNEQDRYFEAARLVRRIEQEHKKQTQAQLVGQLREAEQQGDETRAATLRQEINSLIKEIARGKR